MPYEQGFQVINLLQEGSPSGQKYLNFDHSLGPFGIGSNSRDAILDKARNGDLWTFDML